MMRTSILPAQSHAVVNAAGEDREVMAEVSAGTAASTSAEADEPASLAVAEPDYESFTGFPSM